MAKRRFHDIETRQPTTQIVVGNAAEDRNVVDTRELSLVPVKRPGSKTASMEEMRELRRRLLVRRRFVRGAFGFVIALAVSLGVFFFYYSHHAMKSAAAAPKAVALKSAPAKAAAPVKGAAPAAAEAKTSVPKTDFDPALSAKEAVLHNSEVSIAFVKAPRGSSALSFSAAAPSQKTARLDTLKLRPVPNSEGRYLGSGNVEWQGGWERSNPTGNLKRAEQYMDYLGRTAPGKEQSLSAASVGR